MLRKYVAKAAKGSANDRLHDVAFVRLLALLAGQKGTKAKLLSNIDGLYSQPPGFYLSPDGKVHASARSLCFLGWLEVSFCWCQ